MFIFECAIALRFRDTVVSLVASPFERVESNARSPIWIFPPNAARTRKWSQRETRGSSIEEWTIKMYNNCVFCASKTPSLGLDSAYLNLRFILVAPIGRYLVKSSYKKLRARLHCCIGEILRHVPVDFLFHDRFGWTNKIILLPFSLVVPFFVDSMSERARMRPWLDDRKVVVRAKQRIWTSLRKREKLDNFVLQDRTGFKDCRNYCLKLPCVLLTVCSFLLFLFLFFVFLVLFSFLLSTSPRSIRIVKRRKVFFFRGWNEFYLI